MDADAAPIVVGRITAAHGVRGWVRVASFTDPADNLLTYQPWLIRQGDAWQPLVVVEVRRQGKGFIARIQGCDDRDRAQLLSGRDIGVPASELPEPDEDEYYWFELEGLAVQTTTDVDLGTVQRVFATGANDVLVVRGNDRERLLPFVAAVVLEVDRVRRVITVDWDPEL